MGEWGTIFLQKKQCKKQISKTPIIQINKNQYSTKILGRGDAGTWKWIQGMCEGTLQILGNVPTIIKIPNIGNPARNTKKFKI